MAFYSCNESVVELLEPPAVLNLVPGEWTFKYTYPLDSEPEFKHHLTGDTKIHDILVLAAADYKQIYDEPDQDKYGIWGHTIGDLYFEGVDIDHETKTIEFHMGS